MGVYLRAKFEVASIILTSFRQGGGVYPPTSKRTPKKPTQIRVKNIYFEKFCEGLPLKSKIFTGVSFGKTFGFYYKRNRQLFYYEGLQRIKQQRNVLILVSLSLPWKIILKSMTEPDITLLKKRLWRRCLPVNFAKIKNISFLRAIHVAASVQHYRI